MGKLSDVVRSPARLCPEPLDVDLVSTAEVGQVFLFFWGVRSNEVVAPVEALKVFHAGASREAVQTKPIRCEMKSARLGVKKLKCRFITFFSLKALKGTHDRAGNLASSDQVKSLAGLRTKHRFRQPRRVGLHLIEMLGQRPVIVDVALVYALAIVPARNDGVGNAATEQFRILQMSE